MAILGAHGEPSEVCAEQGEVIVEGPDGVAVTLTPEAAEETARRMIEAAGEARRQAEEAGAARGAAGAGEAPRDRARGPAPRAEPESSGR